MKGNGINKLIKLLNEYDDGMVSWYEEYFSTEGLFVTNAGQGFREEFILGKRYGFIKWLLDNDKIKKSYKEGLPAITKNGFLLEGETALLMLLAISDTPIKDLISYLK